MRVYSSLIYTLLVGVLATIVVAQDGNTQSDTAATTTTTKAALPTLDTTGALTGGVGTTTTSSSTKTSETSTADAVTTSKIVITGGTPATATASVPSLSSSNKLPSLTRTATTINSIAIPVITVPPTSNAPFMQKSSLPEGTVFIAVGSALAFFALAVIAWRGLVAWSLHRSVRRAATNVYISDTKSKTKLRPPPNGSGGFYTGPGSQLSLENIATSPRTANRPGGRQTAADNSLFFSPTAGNSGVPGDRRSAYLPAGYYASGQRDSLIMSQGQANSSHTHLHTQSVSSTRYGGRNVGVSPPGSPMVGPQGMAVRAGASTASLSLPPTGRAPSAYLEDLFESHKAPQGGNGNGRGGY